MGVNKKRQNELKALGFLLQNDKEHFSVRILSKAGNYTTEEMKNINYLADKYERETLKEEYFRDINKGIQINMPKNYFYQDNPNNMPMVTWRGTASVVFSNWLNYCVYQNTPYDLNNLNNI